MVPFLKKGSLPSIPVAEQTPTVRLLMTLVEQQQVVIDSTRAMLDQGDFSVLNGSANPVEVDALLTGPVKS